MTIRSTSRRSVALLAAVASATAGVWALPAAPAGAAVPPWQASGATLHDGHAVGTLHFYDSNGNEIFGGSDITAPIAPYVGGSSSLRSGDDHAALYGYLPVPNTNEGKWSGRDLSAASAYPVAAPSSLHSLSSPVATSSVKDLTLADLETALPNNSTDANYAHIYELRLRTSTAGAPVGASYDVADVKITGTSWSVTYPSHLTDTGTTLTASPSAGALAGDAVTLTATVSPAAAGTVQFADGAANLGTPVAVNTTTGIATKAVSFATAGAHSLTAQFTPTDSNAYAGSTGPLSYTVGKAASTTSGTLPATSSYGKSWVLNATVTSNVPPTGTVTVKEGSTVIGSHALAAGKAPVTIAGTKLSVGKHTLTVRYGGSPSVSPSSVTKTITVVKATSTTVNTLARTTVSRTQRGVLVVTVSAPGVVPTGRVNVLDGTRVLTGATLAAANKGRVSITLPAVQPGKHVLHAVYAGSTTTAASTAKSVTLTVTR